MTNDWNRLIEFWKSNDIRTVRLYGSFARGDAKVDSDVDLIVSFLRRKSLLDLIRIEDELSYRLNKKVDLVTEDSISPYLRQRVMEEAETIYDLAG
jgi:predicted nucleotidyltransferase